MTASCLYTGTVMHRRFKPTQHRLSYRVFWTLLDLDELPQLTKKLRLFSRERFNLFGFYNSGHGDGSATPLREQVETHLAKANIDLDGGAIRLLCMPRILGFTFNPISVYYCYHRTGALAALLYEVHNTFGQRHSYLIPVEGSPDGALEQHCLKAFYVSPFMPMDLAYDFRVRPPGEAVSVAIQVSDAQGPLLHTAFAARRRELDDGAVLAAFAGAPLLSLKVMAGIHWEALWIWPICRRRKRLKKLSAWLLVVPSAARYSTE